MMKRVLCLLLVLNSLFCIAKVFAVEVENGIQIVVDDSAQITTSCLFAGRIVLVIDGSPFYYERGNQVFNEFSIIDMRKDSRNNTEPINLLEGFSLFSSDASLFALKIGEETAIYPITIDHENNFIVNDGKQIDSDPFIHEDGYPIKPKQIFGFGGRLYLLFQTMQDDNYISNLISYDVNKGGKGVLHNAHDVWALCPYKEDKLLALVMNYQERWDKFSNKINNFNLMTYDVKTDSMKDFSDSGVVFNAESPWVYYNADSEQIYIRLNRITYYYNSPGNAQLASIKNGDLPAESREESFYFLQDETLTYVNEDGLVSLQLSQESSPNKILYILGGDERDRIHRQTVNDLRDIPVVFLSQRLYQSAMELAQALVAGDEQIDLIIIRSNYIDFFNIIKKGYATNLNNSTALTEFANHLYINMQKVAFKDGDLYMVPVRTDSKSAVSYNPEIAKLIDGLVLPTTYPELVDLIIRWDSDFGEQYPAIVPFESENIREKMVKLALFMYKDAMAIRGEESNFHSPLLMDMLEAALTVPASSNNNPLWFNQENAKKALFQTNAWFDLDNLELHVKKKAMDEAGRSNALSSTISEMEYWLPLPLSISDMDAPSTSTTITLMFVNAKSANKEQAISYIEKYLQNMIRMTPEMNVMLNPNLDEAISNPNDSQELAQIKVDLALLTEAIKSADGLKKAQLEREYAMMLELERTYSGVFQQRVSKEAISLYRALTENNYIDLSTYYQGLLGKEVDSLIKGLLDGQINLSQFIELADDRMRLIQIENQE